MLRDIYKDAEKLETSGVNVDLRDILQKKLKDYRGQRENYYFVWIIIIIIGKYKYNNNITHFKWIDSERIQAHSSNPTDSNSIVPDISAIST